jgi:hypothetical protein
VEDYVAGADVTMLASMAKLKAGRLAREVADACLQYWGGMGFTWDNPASRSYRDSRLLSIGGGADEIMLGIISKLMGILPGKKKKSRRRAYRERHRCLRYRERPGTRRSTGARDGCSASDERAPDRGLRGARSVQGPAGDARLSVAHRDR